jgi:UDP-N-acetyl-D-galactosamine dehydrogenase
MGLTFKENCPDIRNTKVIDILSELEENGLLPEVFDPWVNRNHTDKIPDLPLIKKPRFTHYDAIIIAVAHDEFKKMAIGDFRALLKPRGIIYDLKYIIPSADSDLRL